MNTSAPNILFIMSDDHAANAISAYGSKVNQTPNLDRIAHEGVRLDHCYVTNSICTPSRAAILTGTYNHVNLVTTLQTHIDNRLPNVAKHLKYQGYQTAIVGKWHLGQGPEHCPTGFDFWSVLPGQGNYYDPGFTEMGEEVKEEGYVTDIITDKCLNWLENREEDKPFFLMCHHKAPHRSWDPKEEHRSLYTDEIPRPKTFDDDYANRVEAAEVAKMRIAEDMTFQDLDLIPKEIGEGEKSFGRWKVPVPEDLKGFEVTCAITGETYRFENQDELKKFKYQRYMQKYLQTVHSVDENVGRLLDWLDEKNLSENTIVIYTSDQGFYLGEHGWFDKRFIYEESFQMPFLMRYPKEIQAGTVNKDMTCNVDFAPTWLDYAGTETPNYMQGRSFRQNLKGETPEDWTDIAYQRYWMNRDNPHNVIAHYGIRDRQYKLIYFYDDDLGQAGANPGGEIKAWELFDLEKDPLELFNLAEDPAYAEVKKEMKAKLDAHMLKIGDIPVHEIG